MRRLSVGCLTATTLLLLIVVTSTAAAHFSPEPLENEVHVLEDHPQDEHYWYDGYDLHHLHVREAFDEASDQQGLIFRFILYGGFGPASVADEMRIGIEATGPQGPQTVHLTTQDDEAWHPSDGRLVYANITEDEFPYTGVTARLQWFVPYDAFDAAPGDQLEEVTMYSWADEDLRDKAPGGIIVPYTGGQGEIPPAGEVESHRHVDALELKGPTGYVDIEKTTNQTHVVLKVKSAVSNGQHVTVAIEPAIGWTAEHLAPQSVPIDEDEIARFIVRASASEHAIGPLPLRVTSDIGAERTVFIGAQEHQLVAAEDDEQVPLSIEPETQDAPGPNPGHLLALLSLAALAQTTRSRA